MLRHFFGSNPTHMKLQNDVIIVSTPLLDTPTRRDNTHEPHKGFLMQNSPTEFLNFNESDAQFKREIKDNY
jgi:hypothetical protein